MTHARISEALRALVLDRDHDAELDQILDRYYAPDYTHRSDGKTLSRDEFTQMVAGVRTQVTEGAVTVLDELSDGSSYAERHVYQVTMANGETLSREVAVFGTLAEDGRFRHLSETGFDVETPENR